MLNYKCMRIYECRCEYTNKKDSRYSHLFADSHRRGQSLIEMMVALGVLTMALVSSMTLLARAIGLNRSISESYVGAYLAGEGVELVKNFIDVNIIQDLPWNALPGAPINGNYAADWDSLVFVPVVSPQQLRFDPGTNVYESTGLQATKFYRSIRITFIGSCEIAVSSTVSWTGSGGSAQSTMVEDHFYDWRSSSALGCP